MTPKEQAEARTGRVKTHMDNDYLPSGPAPAPEHRIANALDYTAHHIGRISKSLERVADALEKLAAKP